MQRVGLLLLLLLGGRCEQPARPKGGAGPVPAPPLKPDKDEGESHVSAELQPWMCVGAPIFRNVLACAARKISKCPPPLPPSARFVSQSAATPRQPLTTHRLPANTGS